MRRLEIWILRLFQEVYVHAYVFLNVHVQMHVYVHMYMKRSEKTYGLCHSGISSLFV